MKSLAGFKITARHAASGLVVVASLYFSLAHFQNDKLRFQRDLEMSSSVVADSLRAAFEPRLEAASPEQLQGLARRFQYRGRLVGVALYDSAGRLIVASKSLGDLLQDRPALVSDCLKSGADAGGYDVVRGARMRVNVLRLRAKSGRAGVLAVFQNASYIENRLARSRWNSALRGVIQAALFLAAVWLFSLLIKEKA